MLGLQLICVVAGLQTLFQFRRDLGKPDEHDFVYGFLERPKSGLQAFLASLLAGIAFEAGDKGHNSLRL